MLGDSCQQSACCERPVPQSFSRVTARSSGRVREARAPELAHAVRWSPSNPWHARLRAASGSGKRRRRSRRLGAKDVTASCVRGADREAAVRPSLDSNEACDAGGKMPNACWPHARAVCRCQPGKQLPGWTRASSGAGVRGSAKEASQAGTLQPDTPQSAEAEGQLRSLYCSCWHFIPAVRERADRPILLNHNTTPALQ